MISAIVLAAGMSTRLGSPKQLLSIEGETMIERVVNNLLKTEVEEIIVVTGYQAKKVEGLLANLNIKVIYNEDYKLGQSTSLIKGLQVIDDESTGILCVLGDQPLVKVKTFNYLINEFKKDQHLIVFPKHNNQRGNPVIFSSQLKPEMLKVNGDQGARDLIIKYNCHSKGIKVNDKGVLFDIDTKEDYQRLLDIIN